MAPSPPPKSRQTPRYGCGIFLVSTLLLVILGIKSGVFAGLANLAGVFLLLLALSCADNSQPICSDKSPQGYTGVAPYCDLGASPCVNEIPERVLLALLALVFIVLFCSLIIRLLRWVRSKRP